MKALVSEVYRSADNYCPYPNLCVVPLLDSFFSCLLQGQSILKTLQREELSLQQLSFYFSGMNWCETVDIKNKSCHNLYDIQSDFTDMVTVIDFSVLVDFSDLEIDCWPNQVNEQVLTISHTGHFWLAASNHNSGETHYTSDTVLSKFIDQYCPEHLRVAHLQKSPTLPLNFFEENRI